MGKVATFCIVLGCVVMASLASMQQDEQDCADQLTTLASCIPFVSGTAKKPTPQCCQDTQKVKANKPKCLCVLIKESTDPSMALPINTTLALQMPSACNIDAKISDCPSILNLPADSPDAKIFEEAGGSDSDSTTTTSSKGSPSGSSKSASTSSSDSTNTSSDSKPTLSSTNNGFKTNQVFSGGIVMAFIACFFLY